MIDVPARFPEGRSPHYASESAAGADLRASLCEPVTLKPGQRAALPTGVHVAIPPGYEGQVRPRSGLALRHGVTLLNAPGTIDSDYRGEIRVILVNLSDCDYTVEDGDRIAQMVLAPVVTARFVQTKGELEGSLRGEGGFGSTGR
jgi:dUTP pyrophosphatase